MEDIKCLVFCKLISAYHHALQWCSEPRSSQSDVLEEVLSCGVKIMDAGQRFVQVMSSPKTRLQMRGCSADRN